MNLGGYGAMPKLNPPDQEARLKIKQELWKNFLVEAGAGSGKTTSLVDRMISRLSAGEISVGQMAAITFTRKAAGELRERFQTELEKSFRDEEDAVKKERLQQSLVNLDQCYVGTIHSFCASLLRERPAEAQLDLDFEELDNLEEATLQDQAWELYLLDVRLKAPNLLEGLENIGIQISDLKASFVALNQYSDVTMVSNEVQKPDLGKASESLKLLVDRAKGSIPHVQPERGWDGLQKAILKADRYFRYFDLSKERHVVSLLKEFDKTFASNNVTLNRWNSPDEAKQYRDEFNSFAGEIVKPLAQAWREYCHFIVMEFMLPAVKYYEQIRFKKSKLNFQDILLKTRNLLRDNPEVRSYFHRKYPCLLVDEFQDTDPVQAEILFFLTGQDIHEKEWHKIVPYPGALFVVGDPKQSIYRFRRADIDTYNLVKKLIVQGGGEVLKLTANFRSVEMLGQWINPIFEKVFPNHPTSYQAEFSPLDTLRSNGKNVAFGVKILDIPADFKRKEEIFEADAEAIARYIRYALDGNVKLAYPCDQSKEIVRTPEANDFMILLRFKDGVDIYARALERYGIPFNITGGSSLSDSIELQELHKLLRLLANPDDQVLTIGVLRGLFFGLSDDALYQIKKAGGYFNCFSKVPQNLNEDLTNQFGFAQRKLREYLHWVKIMMPSVAIAKIMTDLGLIPYVLGVSRSKSRTSYFFQVLELLRHAEISGKTRLDQIVHEFGIILSSSIEDELNINAAEENAVRLMNLHKSKGLEAPVVFLAQPWKEVTQRADIHIRRSQGGEPLGYYAFNRKRNYQTDCFAQPVGWSDYENEELLYLREEERRLVYVAGTRSKNVLIISRSLKDKDLKKNPWALLLEGSSDVSSLTVPEIKLSVSAQSQLAKKIKAEELQILRKKTSEWIKKQSIPSYMTDSPTNLKEYSLPEIRRESGGGPDWGIVIHKVFEKLVNGTKDLDYEAKLALEENGQPAERLEEVIKTVEVFKHTDLWNRISNAEEKYTEVPFSMQVMPNNPLYTVISKNDKTNLPIILSGVIDLAFRERDGSWVVVDYKSDRVQTNDNLKTLLEYYSPQVKIYCDVWKQLTGEDRIRGELYFTQMNETMVMC